MDDPYVTLDNDYIETVVDPKELFDRGLSMKAIRCCLIAPGAGHLWHLTRWPRATKTNR